MRRRNFISLVLPASRTTPGYAPSLKGPQAGNATRGTGSHWKNRGVFQPTLLVVSIALADSLNPSTMAPALYLTTVRRPRRRVAEFAAGVFVVNMVGGALLVLGPGQLILSAVPRTSHQAKHVIELVIGLALLVFAASW